MIGTPDSRCSSIHSSMTRRVTPPTFARSRMVHGSRAARSSPRTSRVTVVTPHTPRDGAGGARCHHHLDAKLFENLEKGRRRYPFPALVLPATRLTRCQLDKKRAIFSGSPVIAHPSQPLRSGHRSRVELRQVDRKS